jgi:demethylmenaquinone methyltransferase/2-methoxy-6-polyprenyl-1,4-benzoquinol methylase/phosphoethanolamine N-methyltransferase
MCTAKSLSRTGVEKSPAGRRVAGALLLIGVGVGISLHLRANHFAHWWVPGAVLLVLAHGAIVGAVVWLAARLRQSASDVGEPSEAHPHPHEHSKLLHRPRIYDWLVRVHTFGNEQRFRSEILRFAELRSDESVLDVGCGTGTLLIEAARTLGSGSLLHGLEPSSEMLAHARRKAKARIAGSNFVQGSADQMPFPENSFDVILCTMVFHHLPPAMQLGAIAEMCRVVRPGGRIVIVDMQAPPSVAAKLSLVTLFHRFGTNATAPDWSMIERALREREVEATSTHSMWNGAVLAMIARIPLLSPVNR